VVYRFKSTPKENTCSSYGRSDIIRPVSKEDNMPKERRKHRRAVLELPLDVSEPTADGRSFKARTVNLSAGGFYCRVPFHVPLMTKLRVSLVLPLVDENGVEEDHVVSCEGMVVRVVPDKPDPSVKTYELACFFSDIDDFDRLMIEQYLAEKAAP
jgi:c-di-GMP-binding flagellar brake protein YcgR